MERVFGGNHTCVHPIVVGIETDEDTLVFHGKDDQVGEAAPALAAPRDHVITLSLAYALTASLPQIFNVCDNISLSSEQMRCALQRLYPLMQVCCSTELQFALCSWLLPVMMRVLSLTARVSQEQVLSDLMPLIEGRTSTLLPLSTSPTAIIHVPLSNPFSQETRAT
jgi:hypothetical protein